ncbi:MAG: ribonuclease-3 [Dasania sp.]|jgi:ribonuclease-3
MNDIPLKTKLDVLQEHLNYQFKDITLLETALRHRSSAYHSKSNERLEFLGDRVLGLVISEYLYRNFSDDEGKLAKRLNVWVCKQSCADAAKKINLGNFLILAPSENDSGGRHRQAMLGDAFEAIIAAIYLDSDLETARVFILRLWADILEKDAPIVDAKSQLQEWSQSLGLGIPEYSIIDKQGPDHDPVFTVQLLIKGYDCVTAQGKSRRQGEFEVALVFLNNLPPMTPPVT